LPIGPSLRRSRDIRDEEGSFARSKRRRPWHVTHASFLDPDIEQAQRGPTFESRTRRFAMASHLPPAPSNGAHRLRWWRRDRAPLNSPRMVGHTAAIAGRSIPANILQMESRPRIQAPDCSGDIAASASPFLTASDRKPHRRTSCGHGATPAGLSCMLTATSVIE